MEHSDLQLIANCDTSCRCACLVKLAKLSPPAPTYGQGSFDPLGRGRASGGGLEVEGQREEVHLLEALLPQVSGG